MHNPLILLTTLIPVDGISTTSVPVDPQIVADHEFILNSCPIDVAVLGEGEITLPKLTACMERKGDLREVPGIAFKGEGGIVATGSEELIPMDELPDLNFENIEIKKYDTEAPDIQLIDHQARRLKKEGHKFLAVYLARGCPHDCFFCYRHVKGYRHYGDEKLEHILKSLKGKKFSFLFFGDECLTANKKNLKKICELTKKYGIYWQTNGRTDQVNHDSLKMLKESNCVGIQYGVESFDNDMLKAMNKNITAEKNIDSLNLNYRYGLKTVLQLVIGSPGEDRNTIFNTRKGMWSCFFYEDNIASAVLNPYPGSPAYWHGLRSGHIKDKEMVHNEFSDKGKVTVNFSKLSHMELQLWQRWLPCEAFIGYRVKHFTFKVDKAFLFKFYGFIKLYVALLIEEPVNFLLFNFHLFKGAGYWLKPLKKLEWNSLPAKNEP